MMLTHRQTERLCGSWDAAPVRHAAPPRRGAGRHPKVSNSRQAGEHFVVRGQKRLQALDFWLHKPDYLAHEHARGYGRVAYQAGGLGMLVVLHLTPRAAIDESVTDVGESGAVRLQ